VISYLNDSLASLFTVYKDIMPDHAAWFALQDKQLPITFWSNSLKISRTDLIKLFAEDNIVIEPINGIANGLRYLGEVGDISLHWTYKIGLLQVQEEVAMLAGNILQPQPSDKVLDLCAAPGNKMAQLAVAMQGRGLLLANDRSSKRMRAAGQLVGRLGLTNVALTIYDGNAYPRLKKYFDYIILDAPCSGEGTFRKSISRHHQHNAKSSQSMAIQQLSLLRKAFNMLKPGGKMIYATCTFSPWENEAVISKFLQETTDCFLLDMQISHSHSKGLTSWHGHEFVSCIDKTIRIWPQQNNTGGFYFACLSKQQNDYVSSELPSYKFPELTAKNNEVIATCLAHFAITLPTHYEFYSCKRGVMLRCANLVLPQNVKIDAAGILAIKGEGKYIKLTTYGAMLLAPLAKKNVLALNAKQRDLYMQRHDLVLTAEDCNILQLHSHILLTYKGFGLGLGWLMIKEDKFVLESYFPKDC
jgi:16S rRNA C967 or C1407 C5-methylase (RsmB/RsmF family)